MFEEYFFGQLPSFLDKGTRSPIAHKCAFEVAVKDPNLHMALFKKKRRLSLQARKNRVPPFEPQKLLAFVFKVNF